jgi:hypothetical protein
LTALAFRSFFTGVALGTCHTNWSGRASVTLWTRLPLWPCWPLQPGGSLRAHRSSWSSHPNRAWWPGLTALALRPLFAWVTLGTCYADRSLRAGWATLALCSSFALVALRTCHANRSLRAGRSAVALRSFFAGVAFGPCHADWSGRSIIALRTRHSR